ncbi:MAG: hypothetical protein M3Y54_13905 [Bacteroidota bacterium]|nr:hypothetical protein [Bacteroidota bacterium]
MITREKAALFIACDFSSDWLMRHGTPHGRALATRAEWGLVLNYVESACRIRRQHLVEPSHHLIHVLHEREDALMGACESMDVFQVLWEAVKRHYEAMDKEPTWFERVLEWMARQL